MPRGGQPSYPASHSLSIRAPPPPSCLPISSTLSSNLFPLSFLLHSSFIQPIVNIYVPSLFFLPCCLFPAIHAVSLFTIVISNSLVSSISFQVARFEPPLLLFSPVYSVSLTLSAPITTPRPGRFPFPRQTVRLIRFLSARSFLRLSIETPNCSPEPYPLQPQPRLSHSPQSFTGQLPSTQPTGRDQTRCFELFLPSIWVRSSKTEPRLLCRRLDTTSRDPRRRRPKIPYIGTRACRI